VDFPDTSPDDFDKDITSEPFGQGDFLILAFAELHESFLAMVQVGFSETQALKFLAYLSSQRGEIDG
jgi:hypothetical protein